MSRGHFIWYDLVSTDPEAALHFYEELFGWTRDVQDMGTGPYTMVKVGERSIGGTVPIDTGDGVQSHWLTYISVDDIEAACAQVISLGGTVHEAPSTIPGVGSWAIAADPNGAIFAPFREENPENRPELPSGVQPGGAVAWHELSTDDQQAAYDFYSAIFGWGRTIWPMDDGEYHGMTIGETPVAGVFKRPPDVPPAWTIYFESPGSIEESAAKVTELGGTILREPFTVEGTGDILVAADPTGAVFGMMKSAPMG